MVDVRYVEVICVDVEEKSVVAFCAFLSGNVSMQNSEIDITMTITEITATILA